VEAVVFTRGIRRIAHLPAFLPEFAAIRNRLSACENAATATILGWGCKPSSRRARRIAGQRGLPYVALEDGFLRSFGLGVEGAPPLSLVVDPVGIYYDAGRPSHLENLLADGGWERPELVARAGRCLERIRELRLGKYNDAPECDLGSRLAAGRRRVLVVDQTLGDPSVGLGLAGRDTFDAMLLAAERDEPGAQLLIKTHPDVIAGKKRGYLAGRAAARGHTVIGEPVEPWSLFDVVDRVYTVTSQLGFEGLLAGLPVRCFGLPFYAGWGATEDEIAAPRRGRRRSVLEIFAAAYLLYGRYVDPFLGKPCRIEDTIELLGDLKRHRRRTRQASVCVGFTGWKRGFVGDFLGARSGTPVLFRRNPKRALATAARRGARLVVWASAEPPGLAAAAARRGVPLARMEDGFLRSVGLGCTLVRPQSLVLDEDGIYFDPTRASELERLLETGDLAPAVLERARRLRERIVAARLSKYNLGGRAPKPEFPADGRRRILVPGQVENDASVRLGSPMLCSNRALLEAVRAEAAGAFVVFKPHPDVETGLRPGRIADAEARRWCDAVVHDVPIVDLIDAVDEVYTLSSLAGFEALVRGKRVVTWGQPFYAGWGLTEDRLAPPRRRRKASLEELIAAALVLYPLYLDPVTRRPCSVETIIDRLSAQKPAEVQRSPLTRLRRLALDLGPALRPAEA
jgi:capsular polysaccharide export protein